MPESANPNGMEMKQEDVKIGRLSNSEKIRPGDAVYLHDEYYADTQATVLEVPRFGWKVIAIDQGRLATIEYQRANWKLLMTLILETKYLKRDM